MTKARLFGIPVGIAALMIMTGCGMTAQNMPTYETARNDTIAAMQRVVDEVPAAGEVWRRELSAPAPCGDGVSYSATWAVPVTEDFDAEGFVLGLESALGGDFELEGESPTDSVGLYFNAPAFGDSGVGVTAMSSENGPFIDLIGTSRCAQKPAD